MTLLTEGDLQVSFDDAVSGRRFDGAEHGLSHCMRAVDFIVEFDDRYLFIEFKDPQAPQMPKDIRDAEIERFKRRSLESELTYKYRDSFLYEWASGNAEKPIHYIVLIALEDLRSGDLSARTEALQRQLPINGPDGNTWRRPFISQCVVLNIEYWNRQFPKYPVTRLSVSSSSELVEDEEAIQRPLQE